MSLTGLSRYLVESFGENNKSQPHDEETKPEAQHIESNLREAVLVDIEEKVGVPILKPATQESRTGIKKRPSEPDTRVAKPHLILVCKAEPPNQCQSRDDVMNPQLG